MEIVATLEAQIEQTVPSEPPATEQFEPPDISDENLAWLAAKSIENSTRYHLGQNSCKACRYGGTRKLKGTNVEPLIGLTICVYHIR